MCQLFSFMTDYSSDTWHRLRKWAEAELVKARNKNDAVSLSETDTATLRGEIRVLKRFLDLPNAATRGVVVTSDE
jgi:hypothetical protein